jgi:hypothetical protein
MIPQCLEVPSMEQKHLPDDADGVEFDESIADDVPHYLCPFCSRRVPIKSIKRCRKTPKQVTPPSWSYWDEVSHV